MISSLRLAFALPAIFSACFNPATKDTAGSSSDNKLPPVISADLTPHSWAYVGNPVDFRAQANVSDPTCQWNFFDGDEEQILNNCTDTYTWINPDNAFMIGLSVSSQDWTNSSQVTFNYSIFELPVEDSGTPDACYTPPVYDYASTDDLEVIQYSSSVVHYLISNIQECDIALLAGNVTVLNLETLVEEGMVDAEGLNYTTDENHGDLALDVVFQGEAAYYSGYFRVELQGVNGVVEVQLWFPTITPLEIVQEQANARVPATIQLNAVPEEATNFVWSVDGVALAEELVDAANGTATITFENPTSAWPYMAQLAVNFDDYKGISREVNKTIYVYPTAVPAVEE